jgi:glutathione synthase/RimK-type ligase-like ATP-grasp enzyme
VILIITNSKDVTADFMGARLGRQSLDYIRLDTDTVARTVRMHFQQDEVFLEFVGCAVHASQVGCVWLRRPQKITVESDDEAEASHTSAEWGEALEGFLTQIPNERWINHPSHNAAASHKLEQLIRARRMGLSVPDTLLTQDAAVARAFLARHEGAVVVKPLSGGYIQRSLPSEDTQIYTSRVHAHHLEKDVLLSQCPALFQAEVDKISDVRVCAVDERVTAVELRRQGEGGQQLLDIRRDNMEGVSYRQLEVPVSVNDSILSLVRSYGLRFAAIDFAVDRSGRWIFLEVNPGGQWAWLDLAGTSDIAGDLAWAMGRQK